MQRFKRGKMDHSKVYHEGMISLCVLRCCYKAIRDSIIITFPLDRQWRIVQQSRKWDYWWMLKYWVILHENIPTKHKSCVLSPLLWDSMLAKIFLSWCSWPMLFLNVIFVLFFFFFGFNLFKYFFYDLCTVFCIYEDIMGSQAILKDNWKPAPKLLSPVCISTRIRFPLEMNSGTSTCWQ